MELLVLHGDPALREQITSGLHGRRVGAYRAEVRVVAGWAELREALDRTGVASAVLLDPRAGLSSRNDATAHPELPRLVRDFPTTVFIALLDMSPGSVANVAALGRLGIGDVIAVGHNDTAAALARALGHGLVARFRTALVDMGLHSLPGHGAAILGAAGTATVERGDVERMARELGVSAPTLGRWCRDAGLPPPGRLLAWGRVLMAANLLDNSGRSVSGVAAAVGYAADSGLRRIFSQFLDASPSELRRQGAFVVAKRRFMASLADEGNEEGASRARRPRSAVDPGDLRRLPPSTILSVGPPSPGALVEEATADVALPAWLVLTDLQLVGVSPPAPEEGPLRRGSALGRDAAGAADILQPLRLLDERLAEPIDLPADEAVANALSRLVEAFRGREWREAATIAAATWLWIQPENGSANLLAGKLLRDVGRFEEAENLVARAVIIARREGSWPAYCEAGIVLGAIHRQRGKPVAARRLLKKVRSRARRHGSKASIGAAAQGLSSIAAETGDGEAAERLAEEALAHDLEEDPPGVVRLARDLARVWMETAAFDDALRILSRIDLEASPPGDAATVAACACRAAADAGHREAFEWFWAEAWRRTYDPLARPVLAPCLADLARAARRMGDDGRALMAIARARELVIPADGTPPSAPEGLPGEDSDRIDVRAPRTPPRRLVETLVNTLDRLTDAAPEKPTVRPRFF